MLTRTHVYALSLITVLLILLLLFSLFTLGFIIPRGHRTHSPPAGTSVAGGVRDLETFPRELRSANWLLGQKIPRSHKILVASIRLEVEEEDGTRRRRQINLLLKANTAGVLETLENSLYRLKNAEC